jgi:hypothetical protein
MLDWKMVPRVVVDNVGDGRCYLMVHIVVRLRLPYRSGLSPNLTSRLAETCYMDCAEQIYIRGQNTYVSPLLCGGIYKPSSLNMYKCWSEMQMLYLSSVSMYRCWGVSAKRRLCCCHALALAYCAPQ